MSCTIPHDGDLGVLSFLLFPLLVTWRPRVKTLSSPLVGDQKLLFFGYLSCKSCLINWVVICFRFLAVAGKRWVPIGMARRSLYE
jgi:hypothetical protein